MHRLYTTWQSLLEVFFPRPSKVAKFDTIDPDTLMQYVRGTQWYVPLDYPCIAPLAYKATLVRDAIHAAKYHGHIRASEILGRAIAPFIAEDLADRRAFGTFTELYITAIPLHPLREKERGFNQSERIARVLAEAMGIPDCYRETLVRVRNTNPQARNRDRSERMRNMNKAFQVANTVDIRGKDILLVDDVVTTGATMRWARTALEKGGARNVLCIAVAH
jgi:ComF family protein